MRIQHLREHSPARTGPDLLPPLAPVFLGDTWEWDGVDWQQIATAAAPPARYESSLVYDRQRGRAVLAHGWGSSGALGDVWEYDGAGWQQRSVGGTRPHTSEHAAAYDASSGRMFVFGGALQGGVLTSATWAYGPQSAASYAEFGAGCAGSNGVPLLRRVPGSLPWMGADFDLRVQAVPSAIAAPFLGWSRVQSGGLTLPFELSSLGMPGCRLRVSPDATFVRIGTGTTVDWRLSFPNVPALVGARLYAQALVLDASANTFGGTLTNAVDLGLGGL